MAQQRQRSFRFGSYCIDTARRQLKRNGEAVPLTPKCFDILLALVELSGEVVSKNSLIKRVWPDSFVEEGNLTYNISMLRKALGERSGQYQYIVTVPGRGYQFAAEVCEVGPDGENAAIESTFDDSCETALGQKEQREVTELRTLWEDGLRAEGSAGALERTGSKVQLRIGSPKRILAVVAFVIIALISVGGYFFFSRRERRLVDAVAQNPISTLAVLPFVNGSGDPEMEYLSDGISESLINSLSTSLRVIARSSSFKYKGKEIDPQAAARVLGVEAIITGRVLQRGDQLQISVELMDARNATQIWGEQYNRPAKDLLALQSEISGEIVRKLRLKLTASGEPRLAVGETGASQAYELLLKGRFSWNKGGTEDRNKALEYFNQSLAVDPAYAPAHAELSLRYSDLIAVSQLDPKEFLPKAQAAARRAVELDENLAEAHLALGKIELYAWNWPAAEREFRRAVELNPNLARARSIYAFYFSLQGQHDQAIAEGNRARELDPLSPVVNSFVGYRLLLARHNDEAIEVALKAIELDKNFPGPHVQLGYAYAAKGQYAKAIAAYQEGIRLGDHTPDTEIYLGAAYAKAGETKKANAILKRLESSKKYVSPGVLAALYVALGERDQAFASLERAYTQHDSQMQFLRIDVNLDPLRSDPRFADLLRRVGLAQ